MKRLALAAVGLALVVGLTACTRTVERVLVVTATPAAPSPTPLPNLSTEEAIGLVQQRKTTVPFPTGPTDGTWKEMAFFKCLLSVAPAEYNSFLQALDRGESAQAPGGLQPPIWIATVDETGRWRVELLCPREEPPPATAAAWTVDDKTQQIIPVGGLAD